MNKCNIANRTVFLHDNLDVLQNINSDCIDLIYLDPPFNKNKTFTAPIGSSAEGAEFKDIFREEDLKDEWLQTIREDQPELHNYLNGIKGVGKRYNFAYLAYMAIRLIECHRILKKTGSIYLHCDPTISHYLKTTLDCIFGEDNFRNEITWQRSESHNTAKRYGNVSDNLLFFRKTSSFVWNQQYQPYGATQLSRFRHKDDTGRPYKLENLTAPRPNSKSGKFEWRGTMPSKNRGWGYTLEQLEEWFHEGRIALKRDGTPRMDGLKMYLDEARGKPAINIWTDIPRIPNTSSERTGYPTQKPLALLERIIKASSNEGDIVLDPFCGCATTCIAAERLDRQWIGIDVSHKAYELVKERLDNEVARPDELFGEEVHLTTKLPVRLGESLGETKHVYIISHPNYPGEYKVGIAKNVKARLNAYQTSDPDRAYGLEFSHETHLFRETEKHIHDTFENKHEWVTGDISEIQRAIVEFSRS